MHWWKFRRRFSTLDLWESKQDAPCPSIFNKQDNDPAIKDLFFTSCGWFEKFMRRHGFSLRRKTTTASEGSIAYGWLYHSICEAHLPNPKSIQFSPCWYYYNGQNFYLEWYGLQYHCWESKFKKGPMKLTGHGKVCVSVCLTKKVDGTRLKPSIIFKGTKPESKFLHDEFQRQCSVASSANRWINEELTLHWCNKILGQFSFCKHLLAWDSYEAHLTDNVKKALTKLKIKTMIVLGGCTKYIQVSDVVWNKPFKGRIQEFYDD